MYHKEYLISLTYYSNTPYGTMQRPTQPIVLLPAGSQPLSRQQAACIRHRKGPRQHKSGMHGKTRVRQGSPASDVNLQVALLAVHVGTRQPNQFLNQQTNNKARQQ
jgi:hypothetical protein